MPEIVHVQAGQCGNQIGSKVCHQYLVFLIFLVFLSVLDLRQGCIEVNATDFR